MLWPGFLDQNFVLRTLCTRICRVSTLDMVFILSTLEKEKHGRGRIHANTDLLRRVETQNLANS